MGSSDCSSSGSEESSSEENENRYSLFCRSSASHSSSSESSEKSCIPSNSHQRNAPPTEEHNISVKPLKSSSAMKRSREDEEEKEASKPVVKKNKENDSPVVKKNNSEKKRREKAVLEAEKSVKEKANWSPKDELAFLRALSGFSDTGKSLPRNAIIYSHVKSFLDTDYDNGQLYNKLRRLKIKFKAVVEKIKSPHEETVFKLSKVVWGRETAPIKRSRDKDGKKKVAMKPVEEEEDDDGSESNAEENKDVDIAKGDLKLVKYLAAHPSKGRQKQLEDLLLHVSTGTLDKAGRKALGTGFIKVIEQLVMENEKMHKQLREDVMEVYEKMHKQLREDVMEVYEKMHKQLREDAMEVFTRAKGVARIDR